MTNVIDFQKEKERREGIKVIDALYEDADIVYYTEGEKKFFIDPNGDVVCYDEEGNKILVYKSGEENGIA
jgi:Zn/Cd-binding protein ZinT